jgi:hypothetical protein
MRSVAGRVSLGLLMITGTIDRLDQFVGVYALEYSKQTIVSAEILDRKFYLRTIRVLNGVGGLRSCAYVFAITNRRPIRCCTAPVSSNFPLTFLGRERAMTTYR